MKKNKKLEIPVMEPREDSPPAKVLFYEEPDTGDDPVEIKAIGYRRKKGKDYVSYILTVKGNAVVKYEESEPDMRAIAEEATKINFVNIFMTEQS